MESVPYGLPRVDPSLLRHIPPFSASAMLQEKTPEKGSGIGTPKPDAREETVEIDMSSPLATATFDARAAYAARVDQKTSRSAARWDGSSREAEDGWVLEGAGKYGLWEVRAWDKLCPGRVKTWKSGVYILTPEGMGVRQESAFGSPGCREAWRPWGCENSLLRRQSCQPRRLHPRLKRFCRGSRG